MTGLEVMHDERGVLERRFELSSKGGSAPGLLWTPSGSVGPRPAILIGHGGTRHKRYRYVLSLARRLVRHLGWAAVALDAPGHGERRPANLEPTQLAAPVDPDQMIRDWQACIEFLATRPEVGVSDLGYWGMSMGASLGIPLLAVEPRIRAAVIGLMRARAERLATDATRITCPVLFLVQWDDTSIPRQGALELFDLLASTDKRLHAHPGDHQDVPEEELDQTEAFFTRYLGGTAQSVIPEGATAGSGRV